MKNKFQLLRLPINMVSDVPLPVLAKQDSHVGISVSGRMALSGPHLTPPPGQTEAVSHT